MAAPNGWFVRDLVIFNELDHRGFVAKGFELDLPKVANLSYELRNNWQDIVRQLIASAEEELRMQVNWTVDSDYKKELLAYDRVTEERATNEWTYLVRKERFRRYWSAMEKRMLRREKCWIYLSRKIESAPLRTRDAAKLRDHYEKLLDQMAKEFLRYQTRLENILGGFGCRVTAMTDEMHYRHYATFLNPSYAKRVEYDPMKTYDPLLNIHENCWHSSCLGTDKDGRKLPYGFYHDGHYYNILALKRQPDVTEPGVFDGMTTYNTDLDYSITVNIYPKSRKKEIEREEKLLQRIKGDYASEQKEALLTSIEKKREKIARLASGGIAPVDFEYIVTVWADNLDDLTAKTLRLQTALNQSGAQYYEPLLAGTCRKLWENTWPGWIFSGYKPYRMDSEDTWLADLLPLSSTFVGHLEGAECLYDGENRNLVGIRNFIAGTPQAAVLFGMTGAGKSAMMCDLLSQTECYYDYTILIEEGLSYGIYTKTMGADPIILHPDGELTMNYLDTLGMPLSSNQLATATALLAKMAGQISDEDRQNLRASQIAHYVNELYTGQYEEWIRSHQQMLPEITRMALAVSEHQKRFMAQGATFLEAWAEFRDLLRDNDERSQEMVAKITEGDISRALKDPDKEVLVRNAAFAYFKPEEYPTHSMLIETMISSVAQEHSRDEIMHIATLLTPWSAHGNYGKLFDGVSNVSLTGKIAHFELGYIPEAAGELKTLAGFLIANYTRQHVITMPRAKWKRDVLEEAARFLDIPGGKKIVEERYAQLRKFNCWPISIVQQYAKFKDSSIRPIIMGNSKQHFVLKQNDRGDVADMCKDVPLPEVTREAILNYPLPENLPPGNKYSSMTYHHLDARYPVCGTVLNRASREMLYTSSSTGADFDKRAKAIKQYPTILDAILSESSKKPEKKESEAKVAREERNMRAA